MPSCAIITCRARSQVSSVAKGGISFHRFPKDPDILEKWIDATGRENWFPTKSSTICSRHFSQNDYTIKKSANKYLKEGAVPHERVVYLHSSRSLPTSNSYVAAVLEYQFSNDTDVNLENYLQYIKEASLANADIVVFPELTLNRADPIPVPINGTLLDHPIPALKPDLYHRVLVAISQAALMRNIYVVINVEEIMICSSAVEEYCPTEDTYLFNTNVVFDRRGAVIDRYRKINLFGEASRTPALRPDLGVFETDFGVTFAHYICFDLQFQVPAVQVVDKLKITDIIFPTMWFSEMPYLSAVQIQEGYAYAMDVNFLAAGANRVGVGSAGSGIFSGKAGALISIMPGIPTSKLLVATVPKVPGQLTSDQPGPIVNDPEDHSSLHLIRDPSINSHLNRKLSPGFQEFTLTAGDTACNFRVNMTENKPENVTYAYQYRAAVFDGVRSYTGVATGGVRLCSVLACTGTFIQTCGRRYPAYIPNRTATFHELTITATVPTPVVDADVESRGSLYLPLSLYSSILPLEPEDYIYSEKTNAGETEYSMTMVRNDKELYSFAIWGRVFARDGELEDPTFDTTTTEAPTTSPPEDGGDGSVTHLITKILLIPVIILLLTTQLNCY